MTSDKLEKLIGELQEKIAQQNILNENISSSPVGWHIEHSLLTIDVITYALKNSDPQKYKRSFNFSKAYVFITGHIPRGRIQSPKYVRPKDYNEQSLQDHARQTLEKIKELKILDRNQFFKHPFLGNIKLAPALKFLTIHTRHHLRIIRDIL